MSVFPPFPLEKDEFVYEKQCCAEEFITLAPLLNCFSMFKVLIR